MLTVIVILIFVLAISLFSEIHALGVWLLLMITHRYVAESLGSSAEHLPMFAGLIIVATIIARKKWSGVPTNILLIVFLLCLLMSAAAIAGLDPAKSLGKLFSYSKGFVLAIFIAGTIKSDAHVRQLTRYGLAGVLIGVCVTFFEYFTGAYEIDRYIQRAGRFTGDPNDTATLLLTGIPLALYWATHSKRLSISIVYVGLIGLIIGAITLTQSRGGFVALLLILIFLYLKKPSIKASVIGLAILGVGIWFVPADSDYWNRMGTLVGIEEERGRSIERRTHYVQAGVIMFLDNPGLGVGLGNFGTAVIAANPTFREPDPNRVAHNMYLEFFVENGVFGGLLFLTLLGIAFLQAIKYDKRNKSESSHYGLGFCVAMSLLSILTSGLFLSQGKSSVLWYLVGLAIAFQVISKSLENSAKSHYPK